MQIKKVVKKIAALGVGVTMLGATLLGATAYDLGDYPAPFVQNGEFNGLMVVGDDAKPADILGTVDIALALQQSATITKALPGSASEVSMAGDAVKFERSGDKLEIGEQIGNVVESMDETDAEGLKTYTVSNSQGSTDVNQYLKFSWGTATVSDGRIVYNENENDEVGDFLKFSDSAAAFQYKLDFDEGFESDREGAVATLPELNDLEDETLMILGEEYTITNAEYDATGATAVTLEMMGGAVHDTLEEGEMKTYTIDGMDFEVTVLIVSDSTNSVKFKINGEVTKALSDGDTAILSDGTTLGVREVLPNEAGETSGGDLAEFYLGANKVTITANGATDTTVDVGEESVMESVEARINYAATASSVSINSITWTYTLDGESGDDAFIKSGEGLKEYMDESEAMWSNSWDISYEGLTEPDVYPITIDGSDDQYDLGFENVQGIEYKLPLIYIDATGAGTDATDSEPQLGKDDTKPLVIDENALIAKKAYFVVTHNDVSDNGVTRVLKYDSLDTSNNQVQLTDEGNGAQITGTHVAGAVVGGLTTGTGTFTAGGYEYDYFVTDIASATSTIKVDLDDTGLPIATAANVVNIVANGGVIISPVFTPGATGDLTLTFTTAATDFDDEWDTIAETFTTKLWEDGTTEEVTYVFTDTTGGVAKAGIDFKTDEDNNDKSSAMSHYGITFEKNTANDPDTLDIGYPDEQVFGQAFVVFEGATVREGSSEGTYEVVQPINVGSAVLASQVSDAMGANIISVGGPAVNAVSAELLGLSYPSYGEASGLKEGEGVIKLVENGDNVAIVVAGWESADTRRASNVLGDFKTWQESNKLAGNEVKVTGTSLTNFDVAPVTEEVVVEEPVVEE